MFKAIHNSLLSLIYPQECRICSRQVEDRDDGVACRICWEQTRLFNGSETLCDKCGALLGDGFARTPVSCHRCDTHSYYKAVSIGVYEKALAASIIDLKSTPILPKRIKDILQEQLANIDFNLIIPVPLSRQREQERGFNQADIIATDICRVTGVTIDSYSLVRKLHTPIHRAGMDQKARELTVKNSFHVARPKLVAGKNILLVDDVFTSGATASACAQVLRKSGAARVNVFTLARAVFV